MQKLESLFGVSMSEINQILLELGTKIGIAVLVLIVGFWLSKFLKRTVRRVMEKSNTDAGLVTFISSLVGSLIKLLVVVTAITQLGIEMTSFVAILGAAGLAIGMAFSGTLSNLAGGIMILVFKPFKVGDFIQAQGESGTVKEIQIFSSILNTPDNKVIIMPNGPLANGNIVNFTKADKRRVDFTIGIAYGDDLKAAKELIAKFIAEDERILKDPEPLIALGALADSSVNLTVRAWTSVENYWPVFFSMNERVYNEFGDNNLNIPFPQMDVHVHQN
mgnify:CR=1 FL=1